MQPGILATYLFLLASVAPAALASAVVSDTPFDPYSGREVQCELPRDRHVRNILGKNGTGCCVWASGQMMSDWHDFKPFAAILSDRLGGATNRDVEAAFKRKAPGFRDYVQAQGKDSIELIDWCAKTGRIACVTWGASHMVIQVHLDPEGMQEPRAAVIDNNQPGKWIWMPRAEYIAKHKQGGAWSYALITPPPPPIPIAPKEVIP